MKSKILIVEDELIEAMNFESFINSSGFDVVGVASTGEDALDKVAELKPDLVLMDIVLKGDMDGIEAAARIKEDFNVPVVYLTAHPEQSAIDRAKLTIPYGYLLKPVNKTDLINTIDLALYKHQMEGVLKESESLYRMLFENSQVSTAITSMDGRVITANEKFFEMIGFKEEEKNEIDLRSMYQDINQRNNIIETLKKGGRIREYEVKLKLKDGTPFTNSINVDMIRYQGEDAMLVTAIDITEQKKAEKELKESERKYKSIIETTHEGVAIGAPEGGFTFVNQRMCEMLGYEKEELIGHDILEFMDEDQESLIKDSRKRCEKEKFEMECKFRKKDGSTIYTLVQASPLYDSQGNHTANLAMHTDITNHKKEEEEELLIAVEKELRDSEELNRLTLSSISDSVFLTDDEGKFTFICPNVDVIFGFSFQEVEKMGEISKLLGERDLFIPAELERLGEIRNIECDITDKSGEVHNLLMSIKKVSIKGGTHLYTCGDITELKKAEDALKKSYAELENHVNERTNEFMEANRKLKLAGLYNRSLIEASLDPLVTIGPEGKINDVNNATEAVTGCSRNKLIGTDFSDYFTEPEKAREGYKKVFKEGFVRDYPLEIQHKDGHITPVLYNASIYRDESGEVVGVFAAARDICELKQAEDRIQMLANVVESSDDAIITKSLEGSVTSWNKGAELVYGYSEEEVIGKDISILAPPHLRDEIKNLIEKIKKSESILHYETKRVRKDGKEIYVSLTLSPIFDTSERLVGISTIARDITQRKQTEEELKKSEKKYRNIFEESFDGLFITSPEGKILDMNKKGIQMFGYKTKEDILRLDLERDVYADPSDRKQILSMVNKEGSAEYEVIVKKKNGNKMITYCSLTAVKDENGVITSYRGIIRDITERKKAENAILQAKEEWENTFDAVPDLITILDTNYHVIRANKAMASRLGVTPEEAIGFTCYDVVHGLNEPPSFCPQRKLLEDGQEHTAEVHEDNIGGDFIVSVSPLYDSEGKLMGSVHVARDITERLKAEEKIKNSLKEKETLLKEIHHRVKNNLQIISSLLDLQEDYVKDDPKAVDVLKESQNRVLSMSLLHEMLYQSKDLSHINFYNYIRYLITDLFHTYGVKSNITTQINVEQIYLNIDTAIPLGLLINELVSNSLKYAFPEDKTGEIKVNLTNKNGKFELIIKDNGIGIPKGIDFNIKSTLGLRLVNTLVNQIDGTIELERTQGTGYTITFPELIYDERI